MKSKNLGLRLLAGVTAAYILAAAFVLQATVVQVPAITAGSGGSTGTTFVASTSMTAPFGRFGNVEMYSSDLLTDRGDWGATADGVFRATNAAGTGFSRITLGPATSSFAALCHGGTATLQVCNGDNTADANLFASNVRATAAGLSAGTGSVSTAGTISRQLYELTLSSTNFICAAVTCDVTIVTLPARTVLVGVYADLTTVFACSAVCTTSTLSATLGSSAGGTDVLVSFDADAALLQRGLADADLGTALARATAVQGGKLFSWSATTSLSFRLTSGTGNIGTGAASNLSTGGIKFYIVTEKMI